MHYPVCRDDRQSFVDFAIEGLAAPSPQSRGITLADRSPSRILRFIYGVPITAIDFGLWSIDDLVLQSSLVESPCDETRSDVGV